MTSNTIIQAAVAAVLATTSTAALGRADDHDHDHPSTPATAAPHEKGHDHGEKEEAHADEVTLTTAAIAQNGIKIAPAESRVLTASFLAPSRISFNAEATAHVGSVVSGRVIEIKVRVGDTVQKNDVLMAVESPELGQAQSEYLQKRTEAEIAESGVAPAKDAYTRAKQLFDESQGIAFSEVQKREVEQRAAAGNAASAKAALQAAENRLHLLGISQDAIKRLIDTGEINPRFDIHAPIAGQVIEREVTLGELVAPDKEKLLVISDTTSLWALAEVPEARLAEVGVGSKAEVQLAAMPGERIAGEVSLLSAEVDPTTRTARLRIVVDNAHGKLRPGMFARTLIQTGKSDAAAAIAVPEEAVQTVEGKVSVFVPVEGEENTFAPREVVVGRAVNGFLPVLSGLKSGESVVISGSFILKAELGKSEAGHEH
jgi:cobalt-zinc-cadmium efflux system membrane fusion protein